MDLRTTSRNRPVKVYELDLFDDNPNTGITDRLEIKNGVLPHIPVKIGDRMFWALINTGASRSVMGVKVWNYVKQHKLYDYFKTETRTGTISNGKKVSSSGVIQVKAEINKKEYTLTVAITSNILKKLILGVDNLGIIGCKLCFAEQVTAPSFVLRTVSPPLKMTSFETESPKSPPLIEQGNSDNPGFIRVGFGKENRRFKKNVKNNWQSTSEPWFSIPPLMSLPLMQPPTSNRRRYMKKKKYLKEKDGILYQVIESKGQKITKYKGLRRSENSNVITPSTSGVGR